MCLENIMTHKNQKSWKNWGIYCINMVDISKETDERMV